MPAISVVIPAFNAEATIAETVASVLQQSWSDFELLVIEPSSTDETARVLKQFCDPRLRIIQRPQGNVSVNRNYGLSLAQGEFTTFLDADDLWTPNKLEAQYQRLQQTPRADVCYSMTDCIDEKGNFLYPGSYATWEGDVYEQLLLSNFVGSGSNFMARTSVLRHIQGFDESLSNSADLDICLKLAVDHQFTVVKRVQILYRIMPNSQSTNLAGMLNSNLTILQRAYDHPKAIVYQHLKPQSYRNLYRFLSYKALQFPCSHGWVALKYWMRAIGWHPAFVTTLDCYKILGKAFLAVSMSPRLNFALRSWIRMVLHPASPTESTALRLSPPEEFPAEFARSTQKTTR